MWTIPLPLKVRVSKKREFTLNLNQYRNTHFQVLNKAKAIFEGVVGPLLKDVPSLRGCTLEYRLYPSSRQLCDVANVCSIVDKFFSDTLTAQGKLEDDNYRFVPKVVYEFGAIDKLNPRVDVTIIPKGEPLLIEKVENMQIILVQAEVEQAIKDYIANRVTLAEGTEIAIDLKAGRGPEGFTASIDIVPATTKAIPAGPIKRAVAPKAVEVAQASDEVETADQETSSPPETASSESTDGAVAESSTAETASDDAEAAPAPIRSLFAGLKKPVNG